MVFKLAQTWANPAAGSAQGFPGIGAGKQSLDQYAPPPARVARRPVRPTKGARTFFGREQTGGQGYPAPGGPGQGREGWGRGPDAYGLPIMVWTSYYDRGAAAYVPNFGKTLVNPIGAGVVALQRPQASYGPAAQYANGFLFWANQNIPTSVNLQGLTDPRTLAAMLGSLKVQGVVRTTG